MANITVAQIIMEAQRMAGRVKELDALSSSLLEEAEGNNRFVESLRQFQDDMDSLNRIANNKSNVDMVNRIQQQNANSSEILKENRELKICIEDYERAMELIMQKYREHTTSKVIESKLNFKEVYNEKLWKIIREQREKINEMAVVMQKAASTDDEYDINLIPRLRLENKTLRELLQISKQYGSFNKPIRFNEHLLEEKGVQTDISTDDSADELSISGASIENANNNSVIQLNISSSSSSAGQPLTDNANTFASFGDVMVENNNVVEDTLSCSLPTPNSGPFTVLSPSVGDFTAEDHSSAANLVIVDHNTKSFGMDISSNNAAPTIVASATAMTSINLSVTPTNINTKSSGNTT